MNHFYFLRKKTPKKSRIQSILFFSVFIFSILLFNISAQAACPSGYIESTQGCYKCKPFSSAAQCKSSTPDAIGCTYDSSVGCYRALCPQEQGFWTGGWWGGATWAEGITFTPACHKCYVEKCAVCTTNSSTCDKCYSGNYYYSSLQKCLTCPTNGTCSDGKNVACKSGYYLKHDAGQGYRCASCPTNATCSNNTVTCNSGYKRAGTQNNGYTCEKMTNTATCPSGLTKSSDGCCCIKY